MAIIASCKRKKWVETGMALKTYVISKAISR